MLYNNVGSVVLNFLAEVYRESVLREEVFAVAIVDELGQFVRVGYVSAAIFDFVGHIAPPIREGLTVLPHELGRIAQRRRIRLVNRGSTLSLKLFNFVSKSLRELPVSRSDLSLCLFSDCGGD